MTETVELPAEESVSRARKVAGWCVAAVVVAALGWVLLGSSLLAVDRVVVTGTERLRAEQVEQAAAVALGTPLARVDTAEVRRRVATLAPVAGVQVTRGWPGVLRLQVVERDAVVGVLEKGQVTLLDGDGVAFATTARMPQGTVRLQVPEPGPDDATTRAALDVLGELPADLRGRLAIVRAPSPSAVSLLLRDGRQVLWGTPGRAADKAAAAQALLRLPGAVYDVTSPDVVVRREAEPAQGVAAAPGG